jgi:hypothetical protein
MALHFNSSMIQKNAIMIDQIKHLIMLSPKGENPLRCTTLDKKD